MPPAFFFAIRANNRRKQEQLRNEKAAQIEGTAFLKPRKLTKRKNIHIIHFAHHRLEEMIMKRALTLVLLFCMILTFTGCAGLTKSPDRSLTASEVLPSENQEENEEPKDEVHPPVTSNEAQLYIAQGDDGSEQVVNPYGTAGENYTVDQSGNIVSEDGTIVVSKENTIRFQPIEALKFSEETYDISLDPLNLPVEYFYNGQYMQYSVPFKISLSVAEPDATNQIILLESSNPEVVSVNANMNAELVAAGRFEVGNGCFAIQPMERDEPVSIILTARMAGEATITARALSGYASAQCAIHVEFGEGDKSGVREAWLNSAEYSTSAHIHSFSQTVHAPMVWEEGFTEYTCEECGHGYMGNYKPKLTPADPGGENLSHKHDYSASTVAPTETERGYTLYVCQECGDSYKANYVNPIGNNPA